jgi:hypothetical protein
MYNTQQQTVLRLLQEAGTLGVNSYALTYVHGIKQAPTRIKELRDQGYSIESNTQLNRSVTYVLLAGSQPQAEKIQASPVTTGRRRKRQPVALPYNPSLMYYDKESNTHKYR